MTVLRQKIRCREISETEIDATHLCFGTEKEGSSREQLEVEVTAVATDHNAAPIRWTGAMPNRSSTNPTWKSVSSPELSTRPRKRSAARLVSPPS